LSVEHGVKVLASNLKRWKLWIILFFFPSTKIKIFFSATLRMAHPPRAPPKIGKNIIFWRKIVIFHTKYPKNVRASVRNWRK
jgi:hypothetical protein